MLQKLKCCGLVQGLFWSRPPHLQWHDPLRDFSRKNHSTEHICKCNSIAVVSTDVIFSLFAMILFAIFVHLHRRSAHMLSSAHPGIHEPNLRCTFSILLHCLFLQISVKIVRLSSLSASRRQELRAFPARGFATDWRTVGTAPTRRFVLVSSSCRNNYVNY